MFDLSMHIALGREYRGKRVQQGSVVYLALEGGKGTMSDFQYVDGLTVLPSDAEVLKLRPSESN